MWRKLFSDLVDWKDNPDRTVLFLEGVRQCGKTYLLKQLGTECFSGSMIYVDLKRDAVVRSIFEKDLDPARIIDELGIYYNKEIVPGKTLIVLDEVQECGSALASLKYFAEEASEYHVTCAGTSMASPSDGDSFPVGKVRRMRLYPMTFFEFLRAEGEERLYEHLQNRDPSEPLSEAIHSKASDHLRNYCLVGGMPRAVESWLKHRSISRVTKIQQSIIKGYREELSKQDRRTAAKLTAIWDSIPNQLMKENRRMVLKDVLPRGRQEVFTAPLQWLTNAGLIHCVHQSGAPNMPLSETKDSSMFKVYPCDVGLLRAMSGVPPAFVLSKSDEYRVFKGAMAETFAVCSIRASGYDDDICYWRDDKNEVDVLVSTFKGVIPMEVKFGNASRGLSLDEYCERYHPETSIHLSMNNAKSGRRMRIPLYSAEMVVPFLNGDAVESVRPVADPSMPFTMDFGMEDWALQDGRYVLAVSKDRHGRVAPSIIQLYATTESGGMRLVSADIEMDSVGDVIIRVAEPFIGKVSIL